MDPFVALSTTLDPRDDPGRARVGVHANYLRLLARVGLTPVLVTPAHEPRAIAALVGASSGLVLSGGEDVAPARYGEAPVPELEAVSPERDAAEWAAIDAALAGNIPVLGICRGIQVLNVYFGGTLYQDLPTQWREPVSHDQGEPWGRRHHIVECAPGSRLHRIMGECMQVEVNSFHHQAVKDLGTGLRCSARSTDGVIEAIEHTERDWVLGIQWHPERIEADTPDSDPNLRLVAAFAGAVRATGEAR